jgi:hypothetical protein
MGSIRGFHAPMLRAMADEMQLETVSVLTRRPGVGEVYRILVHYYDRRACDAAATFGKRVGDGAGAPLELVYRRALDQKPLRYRLDEDRYRQWVSALQGLRFDQLTDQPDLPPYDSLDVWLIERAAGTFYHGVILAPVSARDVYARLVNAVKHGVPEVLREVK